MKRKALSLQCQAKERAIFQPRHYRYYFFTVAIFSYPKRTSDQYRPIFLYDLLSLAIYADILKLHLDIPKPEATGWGRWKATVHIAGVHIRCRFPIDSERGIAYRHVPDGHLRKPHLLHRRDDRCSIVLRNRGDGFRMAEHRQDHRPADRDPPPGGCDHRVHSEHSGDRGERIHGGHDADDHRDPEAGLRFGPGRRRDDGVHERRIAERFVEATMRQICANRRACTSTDHSPRPMTQCCFRKLAEHGYGVGEAMVKRWRGIYLVADYRDGHTDELVITRGQLRQRERDLRETERELR